MGTLGVGRRLRWVVGGMRRRGGGGRWRRWLPKPRVVAACGAVFLLSAVMVCWPLGCTPKHGTAAKAALPLLAERTIRVRIIEGEDQVMISAGEPPVYFTSADPTLKELGLPRNVNVPLAWTGTGWRAGTTWLGGGVLTLRPNGEGTLKIGGGAYRGELRLVPVAVGRFDVVNDVDVDDYLKGVLAKELYSSWEEETFKAQAIVARTYALYQKHSQQAERHWDVHDDTRSQMYGGMGGETAKSRKAAEETAGVVLTHGAGGEERIFKAYFSSCCGGIGQSSMDAFNDAYQEPLSEQYVGNLCSQSSKYTWGPVVVSKQALTGRFRKWGKTRNRAEQNMGVVYRVDIERRNRYGRPVRFIVTDVNGNRYSWFGEELRWAVNTDGDAGTTLYSSFVENIINESDHVRFIGGHGHGHGVGMCQWCAEARAKAGMRHEDIVLTAFPQAKLQRAY